MLKETIKYHKSADAQDIVRNHRNIFDERARAMLATDDVLTASTVTVDRIPFCLIGYQFKKPAYMNWHVCVIDLFEPICIMQRLIKSNSVVQHITEPSDSTPSTTGVECADRLPIAAAVKISDLYPTIFGGLWPSLITGLKITCEEYHPGPLTSISLTLGLEDAAGAVHLSMPFDNVDMWAHRHWQYYL